MPPGLLDGVNGLEGGLASSHHVVEHDHMVSRPEVAFDELELAMGFRGFADGENLERGPGAGKNGAHANGQGQRIGAQGETAHGVQFEAALFGGGANQVEQHFPHEGGPDRVQGGQFTINIERTVPAGRQDEVAMENRLEL